MAGSNITPQKTKLIAVDEQTANALRQIADKTGGSMAEIMRTGASILQMAMGREVTIEGKKKVIKFDGFKNKEALVDID
jgi:transcriptional regulator of heat shock response